jgi:hypothetical protein
MGMNCSSLFASLLFYLSSPSATLPVNSFLLLSNEHIQSPTLLHQTLADRDYKRLYYLEQTLRDHDVLISRIKPYVEDLLEDFNWPGSRCHY